MTIGIKENGTDFVLEITGRLDTATAPTLDKAIKEKLKYTGRHTVLKE